MSSILDSSHLSVLELFPLGEGQRAHHLLYVSGIVTFQKEIDLEQWKNDFRSLDRSLGLSWGTPSGSFAVGDKPHHFLVEASDLIAEKDEIIKLLEAHQKIDLLFNREPSSSEYEVLDELRGHKDTLRILFMENKNSPCDDLLDVLPTWLRTQVHFVYLPNRCAADCLMTPHEVMERLELRTSQCRNQGLAFRGVSFGLPANSFPDQSTKEFYENPCLQTYLAYEEKKNYSRYLALLLIRKIGLAGLVGFVFWILKVSFNPRAYSISQEFKGWIGRCCGWMLGLTVDIVMVVRRTWGVKKSYAVCSYWFFRRLVGSRWKLRVAVQSLLGESWRLKVFVRSKASRVKYKVLHIVLYPFKKAYWFLSYQYKKRISHDS